MEPNRDRECSITKQEPVRTTCVCGQRNWRIWVTPNQLLTVSTETGLLGSREVTGVDARLVPTCPVTALIRTYPGWDARRTSHARVKLTKRGPGDGTGYGHFVSQGNWLAAWLLPLDFHILRTQNSTQSEAAKRGVQARLPILRHALSRRR
jgi:hypothetical protein